MVPLEVLFSPILIYAYEGREVYTFDILGTYLRANISKDEKFLFKLRGTCVDIMCQINPDHKKNVRC